MKSIYSLEQIRQFWTQQAKEYGQSPSASWSDQMVIEMEIRQILRYLNDGDQVLDVGCANGYSTVQFASNKKIAIRGIDYIPEMVDQACHRLSQLKDRLAGDVEFALGDITALKENTEFYDKVIVIRVIINLGDWSNQLKGLLECTRVLRKGGLLLLSEATLQGWNQMNKLRTEWGLPEIPIPSFNQYLDENLIVDTLATELELVDLIDFSSTYYVGTRVLKPLLIQALGLNINVADPNMEWNRWFASLPAWGDYGTQKLFVFKKM